MEMSGEDVLDGNRSEKQPSTDNLERNGHQWVNSWPVVDLIDKKVVCFGNYPDAIVISAQPSIAFYDSRINKNCGSPE